jgi:hypothetical protein
MGLFRRGTKLLKLGSGLRDCCCRPEKPEECWCPSLCSYYIVCDGHDSEAEGSISFTENCFPKFLLKATDDCFVSALDDPVCTTFGGITSNPSVKRTIYELGDTRSVLGACYSFRLLPCFGIGALRRVARQGWVNGEQLALFCSIGANVTCRGSLVANAGQWEVFAFIDVLLIQGTQVRRIGKSIGSPSYYSYPIPEAATGPCGKDQARSCPHLSENYLIGKNVKHLNDLTFLLTFNDLRIQADGFEQVIQWQSSQDSNPLLALPESDDESIYSLEFDLLKKESCQPSAPCDCNQSLDGMIVTFEGQQFNYGSLDNFFNAGTWWEETSAGVFRRRDTEPCDGSLNQTVKQATIECTQIDGVDTWVCYLDHTCEERDDLTCPGPPDASRNKQWTGIFECDENGKPTGSPGSLEVDSDTTSGTPAVECVSALNVPSISISAPP